MSGGLGGLLFFVVFPAVFVITVFAITIVLALVWQRRGLTTQQRAMSHVEETIAQGRRSFELQERMAALAEESLQTQREIVELLRRFMERLPPDPR
jgi:hypothetical protein